MNRRGFLTAAVGSTIGFQFLRQEVFGAKVKRIGLQLYTVRNQMEKDFEGTLARVAQIGYDDVEFAGYFNKTPEEVKQILKKNGLKTSSSHIALDLFEKEFAKTVETAKILGQKYLVCPFLAENQRKTLDDYKKLADSFNKFGAECKKAGLQFAYHNHAFEFEAKDGQMPYDVLLQNTDPKLVKMEMDLFWVVKANQDPVAIFNKYPRRFELVHVKDMDKTPKQDFAAVGTGSMDFKRIFQASKKAGIKQYIVEQDRTPGDPFEAIKISHDYLTAFVY